MAENAALRAELAASKSSVRRAELAAVKSGRAKAPVVVVKPKRPVRRRSRVGDLGD
jgi:hypothetical protein